MKSAERSGSSEREGKMTKKKEKGVLLEGFVEADLARTKSLTDEDLDELKGCLDLGFGFSYDEIPELCNTLPALELCYSMSDSSSAFANWKISSPGTKDSENEKRCCVVTFKFENKPSNSLHLSRECQLEERWVKEINLDAVVSSSISHQRLNFFF